MRPLSAVIFVALLFTVAGCPSAGERGEVQGPPPPSNAAGTGPLANLEASPFMNEVWITEQGEQTPMIFFARENVRISARCRIGDGQLACEAIRYMRSGMPVEVARRSLDGRTSAGIKVCQRLNYPIVTLHNTLGAEDSACRFPDGSLVSTGALEQYSMRVMQ